MFSDGGEAFSSSLSNNVGVALLQVSSIYLVHTEVQISPSFFQPHDVPQPSALQPHDTMLSKMSGATRQSLSTGISAPSCNFHPQSDGGKGFPIHSWSVRYVWYECSLAAALVRGGHARSNDEVKDLQPIDHLYALWQYSSSDLKLPATYSLRMKFSPTCHTSLWVRTGFVKVSNMA